MGNSITTYFYPMEEIPLSPQDEKSYILRREVAFYKPSDSLYYRVLAQDKWLPEKRIPKDRRLIVTRLERASSGYLTVVGEFQGEDDLFDVTALFANNYPLESKREWLRLEYPSIRSLDYDPSDSFSLTTSSSSIPINRRDLQSLDDLYSNPAASF